MLNNRTKGQKQSVLPSGRFHLRITQECARADRHGFPLSLVCVTFPESGSHELFDGVLEHLGKRLRLSDYLGWVEDGVLGILLTDTPLKGARQFFKVIIQELSFTQAPPTYSIYSYPSPDWPVK